MNRRTFGKTAAALAALTLLGSKTRRARAQADAQPLPLFINANGSGGWDVSLTFDPKSGPLYPVNNFTTQDYTQVGAFTLAPGSTAVTQFFSRYAPRILLFNGIFAETVDHTVGNYLTAAGSTSIGFPCFCGLLAAAVAPSAALAFTAGSTPSETGGEVAKTVVAPSLPAVMASLGTQTGNFNAADAAAVQAAVAARLARQQAATSLPVTRAALTQLQLAREGYNKFPGILATLQDLQANVPLVSGVTGASGTAVTMASNPAFLEVQVALAGYVNGATVSANINFGNFDQHTALYPDHIQQYDGFFVAMDYLWRAAAHLGIDERVHVTMGSDFTRTPYNIAGPNDAGKGHWAETTSMIVMGPGITGNRVIGATTNGSKADYSDTLGALPIDPDTLQPSPGGVLMQREHVHYELRRVSGLLAHPLNDKYPLQLPGAPLRLFD